MSYEFDPEVPEDDKSLRPFFENEGSTFLAFYRKLPKKEPDTIRIFYKKDYYVCYDEDADFIADTFYNSRSVIKDWDLLRKTPVSGKMPLKIPKTTGMRYLNLSQQLIETIITSLIRDKKLHIEIYTTGNDHKFFLWKKGSPGNHQQLEHLIYAKSEIQEAPVMMAVKIVYEGGIRTLGVSFCDMLFRKIFICQFVENDHFSNLESLIFQVAAKECLIVPLDPQDRDSVRIHELLQKCDLVVTNCKRSEFDTQSIEQDLKKLLGAQYVHAHSTFNQNHAMSAVACLISRLELLSNDENLGSFKLEHYNPAQYMTLDTAAIQALNLFPSARDPSQKHSLFGILNRCKTTLGSRKLTQWIRQPLVSAEQIERRLDFVEIFCIDVSLQRDLQNTVLRGTPDVERIIKKLQRNKATLQDLVTLYVFVNKFPKIGKLLSEYCGEHHQAQLKVTFIDAFANLTNTMRGYSNLIEEVIDLDAIEEGEYQINPKFDETLAELTKNKMQVREAMKKHEYAVKLKLKNPDHFSLEYDKTNGWIFRVTKKEEKALTSCSKDKSYVFTTISNTKNGVKFQDQELLSLSESWQHLVDVYEENCTEIVSRVMEVAKTYISWFETSSNLIAELDVYTALACASTSSIIPYTRPKIFPLGEGDIVLKQSRHPILEVQGDLTFIPNDVNLMRETSRFLIITGPNMGGKSTFIRQTGVIVLMAQIGCFIPCDEGSSVSVCDAILARVGAGDSQLRGISTFMAEMLETAAILKTASSSSLIIVDELGRGTSTYDGFGLAWAISEHICNEIGAFCLFATHFHECTQLSEQIPFVKNLHVSATVDEEAGLILNYTVLDGPSDQSFGIHVAKIAGLPDSVIEMAKQKVTELENFGVRYDAFIKGVDETGQELCDEEKKILDNFLSETLTEFAELDLAMMNDEEVLRNLTRLKEKIRSQNIKGLEDILLPEEVRA